MTKFDPDEDIAKAMEMVRNGKSLFITGKAGTGKTTLLKKIVKEEIAHGKQVAVTSFTGIAAKNAEGVTLHHFFKIPIGVYIPNYKIHDLYNLEPEQEAEVRRLDMLIIDEISMVRCDTMDAIDAILRHYRHKRRPFGGVQIVLFGDLRQLRPVTTRKDEYNLKLHYDSPYFFDSKVIKKMNLPILELKTVYRQNDKDFINILNHIREGIITDDDKNRLNKRKIFVSPSQEPGIIRLCTHKNQVNKVNNAQLDLLDNEGITYNAEVTGFIPKQLQPNERSLTLKNGARVIFLVNDDDSKYCNGTLGTIILASPVFVMVKTDERKIAIVKPYTWEFYEDKIDKKKKEITRYKVASFTQIPLQLAWAITIHKSQGQTLDKAILIISRVFEAGQVYVALSRCRSLENIIINTEITEDKIKTDPDVDRYLQPLLKNSKDNKEHIEEAEIGKAEELKLETNVESEIDWEEDPVIRQGNLFIQEILGNQRSRDTNESRIMNCLREYGMQTAKEISLRTGIPKHNVNSILYREGNYNSALIHVGNCWFLCEDEEDD